jgi:dUTP pyrophosphatase
MTVPSGVDVLVVRLDAELPVPTVAHSGDAGVDLFATAEWVIGPGERALVGVGLAIALPAGFVGFIHPRSGLAVRHGLTVVNAPGTIDAGYRGEIKVGLVNLDPSEAATVKRGDRIAQLIVQRVETIVFHEVGSLPGSARAVGGFGSSGIGRPTSGGTVT